MYCRHVKGPLKAWTTLTGSHSAHVTVIDIGLAVRSLALGSSGGVYKLWYRSVHGFFFLTFSRDTVVSKHFWNKLYSARIFFHSTRLSAVGTRLNVKMKPASRINSSPDPWNVIASWSDSVARILLFRGSLFNIASSGNLDHKKSVEDVIYAGRILLNGRFGFFFYGFFLLKAFFFLYNFVNFVWV